MPVEIKKLKMGRMSHDEYEQHMKDNGEVNDCSQPLIKAEEKEGGLEEDSSSSEESGDEEIQMSHMEYLNKHLEHSEKQNRV